VLGNVADIFTKTTILNESKIVFELYAFIILTSTLVLGINYFVIITRPLHPIPVRLGITLYFLFATLI